MKFRECDSINSKENVHAGYRNGSRIMCLQNSPKLWCRYEFIVHKYLGPSKTALEFENCKEELFTLTMCLPTYLWAHIARNPFNYTITAQTLNSCKIRWLSILEIDSSVSSIRKNYCIASIFIITRALSMPRDVERRESGFMFCETNNFFKFKRIDYKIWKHSAEKYDDQTMKFTPTEGLKPFYQWVCLLLTSALGILILRYLTGSHMTIFSKSNYRAELM